MKQINFLLILTLLFFLCTTQAQQPWRFHIAFEDGTGQRDTLWMIFDNTATVEGIDYQLGEGTPEYDPNAFNVFMYNMDVDSTKVKAYPYWIYPTMSTDEVFAINYTYPVIIRWDTALFHAPYLPNNPPANPPMNVAIIEGGYQFKMWFDPTAPYFHTTNMFTKDSVFCPEDTNGQTHVPLFGDLTFIFGYDPYLSIETLIAKNISIFPNPSPGQIIINSNEIITSYSISDISGKIMFCESFDSPRFLENYEIPYKNLTSGIYILKINIVDKQFHHAKFIIANTSK